ncbi:MAG: MFS transporter [Streptosporangiaceae bacterium]|nr:MFS transporter [Streptosporangiaceae bacterium]
MITSLRQRNYRLYFFGQLVSVIGTWMQTVAQSFLVLGLTHSGTQLGLTTAARFAPMLVFGPAGGLFADRMDKQRVLYVTQTLAGLVAAAFAVLTAAHVMTLWLVYLLAMLLGFVNVFDNPARQSFISEMVPAADLPNAVTLNSVSMNIARVFGGALGGTIAAALGLAVCFGVNAISFGAVLVSLAAMRRDELFPARRVRRERGQIRAGLRYVRNTPELLIPLVMIAVIGTLAWEFAVSLPLMASKVFHGGAAAYGVMASVMGVGAVAGGLVSAGRPRPRTRALCLAAIGWGVAILAAAAAPDMPLELAALLFVGYGSITFNSFAKTALQLAAKPTMRGRVMALWALAWLGSTPVGGPIVGWTGEVAGARWSLVIGGLAALACGLLALPALTRIDARRSLTLAAGSADARQPDTVADLAVVPGPLAAGRHPAGEVDDDQAAARVGPRVADVAPVVAEGPRAGQLPGGPADASRGPISTRLSRTYGGSSPKTRPRHRHCEFSVTVSSPG